MSVSNVTVKQKYNGNGLTTSFPIPFTFIPGDLTPIKVQKFDDVTKEEVPLVGGDYSLSPAGDSPTAVVFAVAPLTTEIVIISRALPLTQVVTYEQNGPFLAKDHEKGLDRIVMMVQQLADIAGRSLQLNILDDGVIAPEFPPAQPGGVLGFNDDGDALEVKPAGEFIGPAGQIDGVGVSGELDYDDPTPMSVSNSGTATNAVLDFVLRVGRGATVNVGSVTTVAATDPATVTNSGTSSDVVLEFEIPRGEDGASTSLITVSGTLPDNGIGQNGDVWIFISNGDPDTGNLYQKETGAYVLRGNITGPPGGVNTFNTRSGDVVPVAGDYSADMVDYDNTTSGLVATEVQQAIDELKSDLDNFQSLPAGGTTGQILTKIDNTDGNANWQDAPESLPAGGTTGQILTKQSNTDGDADWDDAPVTLPDQTGNAGKFLTTDGTNASWDDVPPSGLVVNATQTFTANGDITLQAVPRQVVKIQSDSGNLWTATLPNGTLAGQEVYVKGMSDSAPVDLYSIDYTLNKTGIFVWDAATSTWDRFGGN